MKSAIAFGVVSSIAAHPLALQGGFADLEMLPQEEEVDVAYDESTNSKLAGPQGFYNRAMISNGINNRDITFDYTESRISGGQLPTLRRPTHGSASSHRYNSYRYSFDSEEDDADDINGWSSYKISSRPLFGNYYTSKNIRPTYPSTPWPSTTPLIFTTEVPDDKKYHLENYSWALGLLNNSADALVFSENETQIMLELSKDTNAPRSSGPEETCSNTPASLPGPATCVYITRCAAARNITVDDYRKSYCRVDNKYAGVCCPSNQIDATA